MKTVAALLLLGTFAYAQAPAPASSAPSVQDELNAAMKKLMDWGGLNVYGSDDTEVPAPKPGENRVVFIGDTLTANWGKGKTPFFPNKPYLNRGIAMQTTPQMLVRFRQDVVALQPKVVVIQGGLNDIGMVMGPGSEGTISDALHSMIDIAKQHNIKVVIASLTPVCDAYGIPQTRIRPVGKIAAINGTLRDIAQETGSIYLNYYSVLVDTAAGTRQMKKELTNNGIDPNDAAYALMAPLAEKAIADALASR
ncbi:MAG TPA: GDSL-type esterase/lipase family protein [Bryobacteraceae bacterium]|nr:GDSL-type esterase/lipase family protein [Bryobacteraceae bacterium]